jgi:hypothetical protein
MSRRHEPAHYPSMARQHIPCRITLYSNHNPHLHSSANPPIKAHNHDPRIPHHNTKIPYLLHHYFSTTKLQPNKTQHHNPPIPTPTRNTEKEKKPEMYNRFTPQQWEQRNLYAHERGISPPRNRHEEARPGYHVHDYNTVSRPASRPASPPRSSGLLQRRPRVSSIRGVPRMHGNMRGFVIDETFMPGGDWHESHRYRTGEYGWR